MFKYFSLPFLTLFLLFVSVLILVGVNVYNRFLSNRFVGFGKIERNFINKFFLASLFINLVLTFMLTCSRDNVFYQLFTLSNLQLSNSLTVNVNKFAEQGIHVDAISAYIGLIVSVVAFVSGLKAMADKLNRLVPQNAASFLLAVTAAEGIFYSNKLYTIIFFIILSQIASYGLYRNVSISRKKFLPEMILNLSRILAIIILSVGMVMLAMRYSSNLMILKTHLFVADFYGKFLVAILIAPLLAIFLRSIPEVHDTSYRIASSIKSISLYYLLLRFLFTVFDSETGLEKIPNILIALGAVVLLLAIFMFFLSNDPIKIANSFELYLKGFIIIATGIAYNGSFTAAGLSQYGFQALEATIALLLIYMPISAVISIVVCFLKRRTADGTELFTEKGLASLTPFAVISMLISLFCMTGMPPFLGYSAKQLVYRTANFCSPFLTVFLIVVTALMFLMGTSFIANIAFGKKWSMEDKQKNLVRDSSILLSIGIISVFMIILTFFPGQLYSKMIEPSASALMNTGYSVNVIERNIK